MKVYIHNRAKLEAFFGDGLSYFTAHHLSPPAELKLKMQGCECEVPLPLDENSTEFSALGYNWTWIELRRRELSFYRTTYLNF